MDSTLFANSLVSKNNLSCLSFIPSSNASTKVSLIFDKIWNQKLFYIITDHDWSGLLSNKLRYLINNNNNVSKYISMGTILLIMIGGYYYIYRNNTKSLITTPIAIVTTTLPRKMPVVPVSSVPLSRSLDGDIPSNNLQNNSSEYKLSIPSSDNLVLKSNNKINILNYYYNNIVMNIVMKLLMTNNSLITNINLINKIYRSYSLRPLFILSKKASTMITNDNTSRQKLANGVSEIRNPKKKISFRMPSISMEHTAQVSDFQIDSRILSSSTSSTSISIHDKSSESTNTNFSLSATRNNNQFSIANKILYNYSIHTINNGIYINDSLVATANNHVALSSQYYPTLSIIHGFTKDVNTCTIIGTLQRIDKSIDKYIKTQMSITSPSNPLCIQPTDSSSLSRKKISVLKRLFEKQMVKKVFTPSGKVKFLREKVPNPLHSKISPYVPLQYIMTTPYRLASTYRFITRLRKGHDKCYGKKS